MLAISFTTWCMFLWIEKGHFSTAYLLNSRTFNLPLIKIFLILLETAADTAALVIRGQRYV